MSFGRCKLEVAVYLFVCLFVFFMYGSPVKVSLVLLFWLYLVLFQVKVHKYRPKINVCSFAMKL